MKNISKIFDYSVRFRDLPQFNRSKIIFSVIVLNVFLIIIITTLSLYVTKLVKIQDNYINSIISEDEAERRRVNDFKHHFTHGISTDIVLIKNYLINTRLEDEHLEFGLLLNYPESWEYQMKWLTPTIDNGTIQKKQIQYRYTQNGKSSIFEIYQAKIDAHYLSVMYPLDKQLTLIHLNTLSPNESDAFENNTTYLYYDVSSFQNETLNLNKNYKIIKSGIIQKVNKYNLKNQNTIRTFYDLTNTGYILYFHKNIRSYLRDIQYVFLSIIIGIMALLINPQKGSAISGRISVIGSSIFSLAANIFQTNSILYTGEGVKLLDLINIFAGVTISFSFIITIYTIKLNDKLGHDTSKIYDLIMFKCLIVYTSAFFTIIYILG